MADHLDHFGFPMTVAEYLYIGAPDDDCAQADAQQQAGAVNPGDIGFCQPLLSCAICGDYAGTAAMSNKGDVEAEIALMNAKALCFRHWDRRHLLFRRMSVEAFIAQERASLNPPAEAAA